MYEKGGKTILASLKPIALLAMFNVQQLEGVAQDVEMSILPIMKEGGHRPDFSGLRPQFNIRSVFANSRVAIL